MFWIFFSFYQTILNLFEHGNGIMTWPDGNKYEGKFKNDKRNGYGTFTWSDGNTCKGTWKNDQFKFPPTNPPKK